MKFVPLFLLCCISSAAAQTLHIEPANPILVGEPLSIKVDGLPSDQNVTVTAERTIEATKPGGAPALNVGLSKSGGTPQANADAQARAFPETIAFLKRTLRVDTGAQR